MHQTPKRKRERAAANEQWGERERARQFWLLTPFINAIYLNRLAKFGSIRCVLSLVMKQNAELMDDGYWVKWRCCFPAFVDQSSWNFNTMHKVVTFVFTNAFPRCLCHISFRRCSLSKICVKLRSHPISRKAILQILHKYFQSLQSSTYYIQSRDHIESIIPQWSASCSHPYIHCLPFPTSHPTSPDDPSALSQQSTLCLLKYSLVRCKQIIGQD